MRNCVIGRVRKEETKSDFDEKEENLIRSKDEAVINENYRASAPSELSI